MDTVTPPSRSNHMPLAVPSGLSKAVQEAGEKEVTSRVIGERVLEELVALDTLAAARYASVFLNFENAADYSEFFASIGAAEPPT